MSLVHKHGCRHRQLFVCLLLAGKVITATVVYHYREVVSLLVLWTLVLLLAQPAHQKGYDWKYIEVQKTAQCKDIACICFA